MCSFEAALPFVALAIFSGAEWEKMLRERVDSFLPGSSGSERNRSEPSGED